MRVAYEIDLFKIRLENLHRKTQSRVVKELVPTDSTALEKVLIVKRIDLIIRVVYRSFSRIAEAETQTSIQVL